jgi:hypothetical protein
LRLLARRYRIRQDTTLRPVADVMFDLRLRHGLQLTMSQIFELLDENAWPHNPEDTGPQPATDSIQADLKHLGQLATTVLGEHVNDRGLCAVCRAAFPCDLAVLAEHNLALL